MLLLCMAAAIGAGLALFMTCPIEAVPYTRGIVFPSANLWFADRWLSLAVNLSAIIGICLLVGLLGRTYTLTRVPTDLDASFFMIMSLSVPALFLSFNSGTMLCLTLVVCLFLLYSTYGDPAATRPVYTVFLILSAMSMTQYCYLVYIPVFIVGCLQMRAFSGRMAMAVFLGLLTPWWILGAVSLVMPVTVSFPDIAQIFSAFDADRSILFLVSVALSGILLLIGWLGNFPRMIAYNAHRRAYNGTISVLSLMTVIAAVADFSNMAAYTPTLALCAAVQLGRLFSGRSTKGANITAVFLLSLYLLIFLCYPARQFLTYW